MDNCHTQAVHLDPLLARLFPSDDEPAPVLQEEWGVTRKVLRSMMVASGSKSSHEEITAYLSVNKSVDGEFEQPLEML